MMENGKEIKEMVKESNFQTFELSLLEVGKMIFKTVNQSYITQMQKNIQERLIKEYDKGKAFIISFMAINMKDNGKMII